jgi:DNA end-binding protein Ku
MAARRGTILAAASHMPRTSRSLQSATLSLGLVAIPVGLHATRRREGRVSYHLVHKTDGSRVKRQYVCVEEGVPVEDEDLARAYEGEDGEEAVLSAAEAKATLPKSTGRIDLLEFVPADTIDPVYFDNAYYLAPGKGGDRAYHLLAGTLRDEGVVAVGTQIARGKSYLVAVRASEVGMVMHTLHHAEEVHVEDEVPHGEPGRVSAAERELAATLVKQLRKPRFEPARFEDDADEALRTLIKAHAGKGAKEETKPARGGQIVDLLASLKASLEGGEATRKRTVKAKPKAARRGAKPKARSKTS